MASRPKIETERIRTGGYGVLGVSAVGDTAYFYQQRCPLIPSRGCVLCRHRSSGSITLPRTRLIWV